MGSDISFCQCFMGNEVVCAPKIFCQLSHWPVTYAALVGILARKRKPAISSMLQK
jgi:hypothetical protein